jgi:hypothetical protein
MTAVISNFRVMERSFIHVRHPISASVGWHMWSRPTRLPCKNQIAELAEYAAAFERLKRDDPVLTPRVRTSS